MLTWEPLGLVRCHFEALSGVHRVTSTALPSSRGGALLVTLVCSSPAFPLPSVGPGALARLFPACSSQVALVPASGGVLVRPKGKRRTLPLRPFPLQNPAHPSRPSFPGLWLRLLHPGLCLGPSCPVVWKLGAEQPTGSPHCVPALGVPAVCGPVFSSVWPAFQFKGRGKCSLCCCVVSGSRSLQLM